MSKLVVVIFIISVTKYLKKNNSCVMKRSLKVHTLEKKARQQELEGVGQTAYADVQLTLSFLFNFGPQYRNWCYAHAPI